MPFWFVFSKRRRKEVRKEAREKERKRKRGEEERERRLEGRKEAEENKNYPKSLCTFSPAWSGSERTLGILQPHPAEVTAGDGCLANLWLDRLA